MTSAISPTPPFQGNIPTSCAGIWLTILTSTLSMATTPLVLTLNSCAIFAARVCFITSPLRTSWSLGVPPEVPFSSFYEFPEDVQSTAEGDPAGLNIVCRSPRGPSLHTIRAIRAIHAAVERLGNPELTALAPQLMLLQRDGRRDGNPWYVYVAACLNISDSGFDVDNSANGFAKFTDD